MFLLQQSHRQDPGRGDLPCYLQAGEQEEGLGEHMEYDQFNLCRSPYCTGGRGDGDDARVVSED
jgi:hypothetical protein